MLDARRALFDTSSLDALETYDNLLFRSIIRAISGGEESVTLIGRRPLPRLRLKLTEEIFFYYERNRLH